jgi:outer membrane protein, heavy metal efflux system
MNGSLVRRTLWSRGLAIACIGAALTGCADFHPQPLSPADNATALESRTLADERLQRFLRASLPADSYAVRAPDWGLGKLTLAALYYHPDLPVARAALAGSQAGVVTAHARPNPTLSLTAVFGTAAVSGAFPPDALPLVVGPVVDFLIETAGKREARTAQAQHIVDAAREDLATATWQVRGRVRVAMLNLWASRNRLKLGQEQIRLRQQLVALLEQRFAAGEATALDLARERVALAQATLGHQDELGREAEAQGQLATAIGVPAKALNSVQISVTAFDHVKLPKANLVAGPLRRQALTERSDVKSSLALYEAAQAALRLQIAKQYPDVRLGPGYNYEFGTNRFILSPVVDLPIFNQNQGPIAQAVANRQEAAANFTALQAKIIGAIDAAGVKYGATTQSLRIADRLSTSEQLRQRQARAAFASGATDRPTLITTELEAAVIWASRFDALVQQRQALGALEDALQQPLFDPQDARLVPRAKERTIAERSL